MAEYRYFHVFGFLINYSILIVMSGSLLFTYSTREVFLTALILWVLVALIRRYKAVAEPVVKALAVLYAMALAGYFTGLNLNLTASHFLSNLHTLIGADKLAQVIGQATAFYSGNLKVVPDALDMQVFAVISGVITFQVSRLTTRRSIRTLLILPPIFFMVQWTRYVDISFVAIRWYMIGFVGYLMHVFSKVNLSKSESRYNKTSHGEYFFYSLAIATTIMVLTGILFAIYPLDKINDTFSGFMPTFSSMRTGYTARSDEYIYSFSGSMYMPEEDRLGGRIIDRNYEEVMRVASDRGGQYLRGSVKDQYTGNSWSTTETVYRNRIDYGERNLPHFDMTVYPTYVQTATIFAPLGVRSVDLNLNKLYISRDELYYYKRDSFETRLESYSMTVYETPVNQMLSSDLDPYLQLPDEVSERVRDLSLLITSDDQTASERVDSIQSFLKNSYPYTLFVGPVPREAEFVDYFLFEEQKGYCTYFATAAAVMARINGIPSRYVEGYISEVDPNSLGYYEVTGDRAHAWAEVYIDGVWQTLEATPRYIEEGVRAEYVPDEDGTAASTTPERPPIDDSLLEPDIVLIEEGTEESPSRTSLWMVAIALVAAGCLVLWLIFKRRRPTLEMRLRALVKMIESDETTIVPTGIPELQINAYAMKMLGYRLTREKKFQLQKALYSSMGLNPAEKKIIIEEIDYLEQRMKEHLGPVRYMSLRRRALKQEGAEEHGIQKIAAQLRGRTGSSRGDDSR